MLRTLLYGSLWPLLVVAEDDPPPVPGLNCEVRACCEQEKNKWDNDFFYGDESIVKTGRVENSEGVSPSCTLLNAIPDTDKTVCQAAGEELDGVNVRKLLASNEGAKKLMESKSQYVGFIVEPGNCDAIITGRDNCWDSATGARFIEYTTLSKPVSFSNDGDLSLEWTSECDDQGVEVFATWTNGKRDNKKEYGGGLEKTVVGETAWKYGGKDAPRWQCLDIAAPSGDGAPTEAPAYRMLMYSIGSKPCLGDEEEIKSIAETAALSVPANFVTITATLLFSGMLCLFLKQRRDDPPKLQLHM